MIWKKRLDIKRESAENPWFLPQWQILYSQKDKLAHSSSSPSCQRRHKVVEKFQAVLYVHIELPTGLGGVCLKEGGRGWKGSRTDKWRLRQWSSYSIQPVHLDRTEETFLCTCNMLWSMSFIDKNLARTTFLSELTFKSWRTYGVQFWPEFLTCSNTTLKPLNLEKNKLCKHPTREANLSFPHKMYRQREGQAQPTQVTTLRRNLPAQKRCV